MHSRQIVVRRARSLADYGGVNVFWLLIIFVLLACESSPVRELQGRWYGDGAEQVELERLAAVTAWAKGLMFEFNGNQLRVSVPNEAARAGRYEVIEAGQRQLVISIQRPGGQLDVARLTLDAPDRMRWHIGEGRAIVLRRAE